MGRRCERQKALLQVRQEADAARGCSGRWRDGRSFLVKREGLVEEECVESGIMVLLVKQVHLQNEGGAGGRGLLVLGSSWTGRGRIRGRFTCCYAQADESEEGEEECEAIHGFGFGICPWCIELAIVRNGCII